MILGSLEKLQHSSLARNLGKREYFLFRLKCSIDVAKFILNTQNSPGVDVVVLYAVQILFISLCGSCSSLRDAYACPAEVTPATAALSPWCSRDTWPPEGLP